MASTYGKSATVVVGWTVELVVEAVVVKAVVVEAVVIKAAVEVDDVVGTLMTPDLLFTVAIVTIPAVHIATSITNQRANL